MNKHIIQYVAAAIIVMILGGFVGWFVFVRTQIQATDSVDTARGVGSDASTANELGSSLSNLSSDPGADDTPIQDQSQGLWARIRGLFSRGQGSDTFGGMVSGFGAGILGEGFAAPNAAQSAEPAAQAAPRFWQISRTPVAGAGFASTTSSLYYAERASGNILVANPTRTEVRRVTNTLFPKTIEAVFASDGSVVLRSIGENGEAVSYAGIISTSTSAAAGDAPNKLEGAYLPRDIISIDVRSAPNSAFFTIPDTTGGSVGITSDWRGGSQKRIFASPLSGWRAITTSDGELYLLQKPSDDAIGYMYRILPNGSFERILGDLPGLVALPKAGSRATLYSTSSNGDLTLIARTGSSADTTLNIKTSADKCVWSRGISLIAYCAVPERVSGKFLKEWYIGSRHTKDAWWKVDVSAGTVERLDMPDTIAVDVYRPVIDSTNSYVAFMNAGDRSLLMLSLNQ